MNSINVAGSSVVAESPLDRLQHRSLVNPFIDFLCLGGGSLLLLAALALTRPSYEDYATWAVIAFAVANVVNHPHFAFSYQIFYRNFFTKAFGSTLDSNLRRRYVFAGAVVPVALVAFFGSTFISGDPRRMAWAASAMLLLVGWHYVKQGYGMLIVGSVLERRFFGQKEKDAFLHNAYACWGAYWLGANWVVSERNLWGLKQYMLPVPDLVLFVAVVAAGITSCRVLAVLFQRLRERKAVPFNGLVAYFTTLYVWLLLLLNPLFALVIPACHSLQYIVVVWRFESNRERCLTDGQDSLEARSLPFNGRPRIRLALFASSGLLLGYVAFWWAPELLGTAVKYDQAVFGPDVFLFMFWTFINIHHYFLDNVMWRKENSETARFLFA